MVKIVRQDRIELNFDTAGSVKGKPGFKVIEEKKKTTKRPGRGIIGAMEGQYFKFIANMISTRGGVLKDMEFTIK